MNMENADGKRDLEPAGGRGTAYAFLRKVPLFADLSDADLEKVCQQVEEVYLPQGEVLFTEGSEGDQAYVIKEGQIEIYRTSEGQKIQLAVRTPGEVIGEISLLEATPRNATGQALTDSVLLAISHQMLDHLLSASPSAARTMLHTISSRLVSTEKSLKQAEKMAQLGTLTAGIAHEINNPTAAILRGAEQLKTAFGQFQHAIIGLYTAGVTRQQVESLQKLEEQIGQRALIPTEMDPVARSDREAELEDWLDENGIENTWELAPQLAGLDYDVETLEALAATYSAEMLPALLEWMAASYAVYRVLDEIGQGAGRISEIVKALKSYVYLDQGPVQEVNVHEGLDNTLIILRNKLKQGIEVRREYDPNVPRIQAYGSELNQVWTNIIDNAIDALGQGPVKGKGKIVLRTTFKDPWVVVDIADTGPGIPPEVLPKLFSPFFTTKPMGKGTGLGLNTSYNIIRKHGGDVKVTSQPGETHFEVWLPVDLNQVQSGGKALQPIHRASGGHPSDNSLRHIFDSTRTIAVVGITDKVEKPNYYVPAYLQQQGYRILPVNPRLERVLGEKAYPDLLSIPDPADASHPADARHPIDVVLIFRPSESVPEIVDQAIKCGAKVVWMQEGIANEAAAQKASQAGIEVVMDTCMRDTHMRIFG